MAITRRTTAVCGIVLLFAAAALSACSSDANESAPTPSPTASEPSPEPSEAPEEDEPSLFTVSAKVRAVDGTTMDITLVGRPPLESTDSEASDILELFVEECSALNGHNVSSAATPVTEESLAEFGSSLMRLDYSVTPDGHTLSAPVDLEVGSRYSAEVAAGEAVQPVFTNEICTGTYQVIGSGAGSVVVNFESGNPIPDPDQWTLAHYGFTVPFESGATIEACAVELSDEATAAVAEIPGWEFGADVTGISCGIGYLGE